MPPNTPRELFLQEVYCCLYRLHPRGLTFTQIGQLVRRSAYAGSPTFGKLSRVEPTSFITKGNKVFANVDSPRRQRIRNDNSNFDPMIGFSPPPTNTTDSNPSAMPPVPPITENGRDVTIADAVATIINTTSSLPPPPPSSTTNTDTSTDHHQMNPNNIREYTAITFYNFLQTTYQSKTFRSLFTNIERSTIQSFYNEWKQYSKLRCGLYYILKYLQHNRYLRYTRSNKIIFKFMKNENYHYINLERAKSNKGGIIIKDLILPDMIHYKQSQTNEFLPLTLIEIENHGSVCRKLTNIQLMKDTQCYCYDDIQLPLQLQPNETYSFTLQYRPLLGIGCFPSSLSFTFDNSFAILKTFTPNVTNNPTLRQELKATSPYIRKPHLSRKSHHNSQKIDGELPPSVSRKFKIDLYSEYKLTPSIIETIRNGEIENELIELYQQYKQQCQQRQQQQQQIQQQQDEVISPLTIYSKLQQAMLLVEEYQMLIDMDQYNLENVILIPDSNCNNTYFYYIDVPGLAEKRPSILIGDKIEVKIPQYDTIIFRGFVWDVEQIRIKVKFHSSFPQNYYINGMKVNIYFTFRRTGLKLIHDTMYRMNRIMPSSSLSSGNSMNNKHTLIQMLFPIESTTNTNSNTNSNNNIKLNYFNRNLNYLQQKAIKQIITNYHDHASSTFILFGPPGTGKTITLVEAIKQLHFKLTKEKNEEINEMRKNRSLLTNFAKAVGLSGFNIHDERYNHSIILVMAPSNYAADLLVERLSDRLNNKEMFRFMSYSRKSSDVLSSKVLEYCKIDPITKHFINPSIEELLKDNTIPIRIIVCTCSMASRLYYNGFLSQHFAAFFIDESGHCWESEAVAGFANLIVSNNHNNNINENTILSKTRNQLLILAGDPKQLGPITRSPFATITEFDKSLLERLIDNEKVFFKDIQRFPIPLQGNIEGIESHNHGYNSNYIVKLTNCYRCHPNIIKIPNELFYDNDLQSMADPMITESCLAWDKLPNKKFPMIFHGCVGINEQEKSSPSWFNITEIEIVLQYVQDILTYGQRRGIVGKDIGIIAPYSCQVKKIKQALKSRSITSDITIGSCEQFQGQERKVIIISTVRSSLEYLESDEKYNIGFLSNPKRFNVAITRAKALVIVIGNPQVLASDPCWGKLLWYCVDNSGYTGNASLPPREGDAANATAAARTGDVDMDELADLAHRLNLNDNDITNIQSELFHDITDHEWRREE